MSIEVNFSPNSCDFGAVPARRKKYVRVAVTVGDPFSAGRNVRVKVSRPVTTPDQFVPLAALGWEAVGTNAVQSPLVRIGGALLPTVYLLVSLSESLVLGPLAGSLQLSVVDEAGNPLPDSERVLNVSGSISAAQTVTLALVIDRSTSMGELLAGESRVRRALSAATALLALMEDTDRLGIVSFAAEATELLSIGTLNQMIGTSTRRQVAQTLLDPVNLNPAFLTPPGQPTCIYAGVQKGRIMLYLSPGADKNLIVLTDGLEDYGNSVSKLPQLPDTYAIGVPSLNTTSLSWLTSANGYLSVDGAVTGDVLFKVQKYAAQIFANVSNTTIVVDPDQALPASPQAFFDLEFSTTELDEEFKVVVFAKEPERLTLEPITAPSPHSKAETATAADLSTGPARSYESPRSLKVQSVERSDGVMLTRLSNDPDPAGLRPASRSVRLQRIGKDEKPSTTPFSYLVIAKSDLVLDAQVHASSPRVGGELLLTAVLFEAGLPITERARVQAEVRYPEGVCSELKLSEDIEGRFTARLETLRPGLYEVRFKAQGKTVFGTAFHREQLRTVAIQPARC
ncbi:MAG TPA: VWA domain-containing protein [Polyangiaceae bacterium]|nr:VWA domain-containing protein [Polyangiaceae bacterium]